MKMRFILKQFISTLSLFGISSAGLVPKSAHLTPRGGDNWPYGVIGDSWGSGVSYNNDVLYDGNLDNCLRTKESHGPQMEADTSWTGDYSSGLRDAACSGSQLVDLAKGQYQMGKVGKPNLVVMTSGGNNAGFGHIVDVCIYHSDPLHNYGPAYKDDDPNDPKGQCGQALNSASTYINEPMRQDLINTINDILADPHVHENEDFLLYLTGYAQFFGTDYDPWCNNEYWNVPGISARPYLSEELRRAFNGRVSAVNKLYQDVISTQYADKARYIDLDSGFSGHRFCESGASHSDQLNKDTNFNGVYLWNLNWRWQVVNQPAPQGVDPDNISPEEAAQLFNGSGVTAWTTGSGGGGGNVPDNGWRLRPFHPRTSGYTSIKNAILAQLKSDGLPKAPSTSTSPRPPPPPPPSPSGGNFAPGTCSFHLDEWQSCADDSQNLFARITMYDDAKKQIGKTTIDPTKNLLGDPINVGDSLNFQSELPYPLVVTGEHENDYVQFNYNRLQFKSTDKTGPAMCTVGGWDPRDGPVCGLRFGNQNAVSDDSRAEPSVEIDKLMLLRTA
ncbi:MAG: hypothetical protein Q9190_000350 [Brigantiaea leucoxantha]